MGGRGGADNYEKIHQRVEYGLYYIENWSILFDIWIFGPNSVCTNPW
jgi:lipopolysaccharide/colanic/teichoic acid biosynthesis glycosyltransferase